jgi:hypothetical protein
MASAAVQLDEESLIREIIAQTDLPDGVKFKRIEPTTEWTGEAAWRITFAVSKSIPLTKRRLEEIHRMRHSIQDQIFALKFDKWPFFSFVDAR